MERTAADDGCWTVDGVVEVDEDDDSVSTMAFC